jgi:cytochrome c peroxidase
VYKRLSFSVGGCLLAITVAVFVAGTARGVRASDEDQQSNDRPSVLENAARMISQGRHTFRFDTFGDEAFWGGTLQLHNAIKGVKLGGVGPGVSPNTALAVGLKVDVDALLGDDHFRGRDDHSRQDQRLRARALAALGAVNLDDPATTVALLRAKAVVGLTGFFDNSGSLQSIGIQCALCHSTVDDVVAPGIGRRLDARANRDLNVGAIVSLAPNLQPVADLLKVDVPTVRTVLGAWGPGKFDAELFLDGKGFRPDGKTAATLIPPAFGLAGVNLHTWTGWGSVTHWNAFVATLEMHGKGRFFDPRLNDALQFPIAAANGFGDLPHIDPDDDRITKTLPALHFYQLSIPAPKPVAGRDFDAAAAARGDELFSGKAGCNGCHVEPLWTEPGWNMHKPEEVCVDSFQADRAPDHRYRTSPLAGLFTHQKGGFYHDGRFATLGDVVNHYNSCMNLNLSDQEMQDLVQYLLSL